METITYVNGQYYRWHMNVFIHSPRIVQTIPSTVRHASIWLTVVNKLTVNTDLVNLQILDHLRRFYPADVWVNGSTGQVCIYFSTDVLIIDTIGKVALFVGQHGVESTQRLTPAVHRTIMLLFAKRWLWLLYGRCANMQTFPASYDDMMRLISNFGTIRRIIRQYM